MGLARPNPSLLGKGDLRPWDHASSVVIVQQQQCFSESRSHRQRWMPKGRRRKSICQLTGPFRPLFLLACCNVWKTQPQIAITKHIYWQLFYVPFGVWWTLASQCLMAQNKLSFLPLYSLDKKASREVHFLLRALESLKMWRASNPPVLR